MTDPFPTLQRIFKNTGALPASDVAWLINEVVRTRRIEDAARVINFDAPSNMGKLERALEFNPRPGDSDG